MDMDTTLHRRLVEIPSDRGIPLPSVVVSPATETGRAKVVIFCQAGLQNKGGVGDYFRWLGDAFASKGYHCVRFDPLGTGDALGEIVDDVPLDEFFVKIQSGVCSEDTAAVVRWVHQTYDDPQVVLWGQCGGCIPAVMVSADAPRKVSALVLMAPPSLYSQPLDTIREFDATIARKAYLRKLLNPGAYLRLLSGKSEYRLILAAIQTSLRTVKRQALAAFDAVRQEPEPEHPRLNDHLWRGLAQTLRHKKPVLILLAERDNETPEFEQTLLPVLRARPSFSRTCTVETIRDADHSLMMEDSRLSSLDQMVGWMDRTLT